MFRVLVLQAPYTLFDEQTEYQLRDRLSFMRFVGLAPHDPVPDAETIWLYREQLTRAGALARLFARFDAVLAERGYLAMGGQIVDATVVEARRTRPERLDRQIEAHRAGSAELAARQRELASRIDAVEVEIQAVERELAASPTQAQLVQLERRPAELEQTHADLLTLYRAL